MSASLHGATVLLGLGANLGDPVVSMRETVARLAEGLSEVDVSAVYRSPPEGGADQPDYLNAVIRGRSPRSPFEILAWAQEVESAAGRTRPYSGSPRTMDIDVLFVGEAVLEGPELVLPHPRWSMRDFVVVPLLDVAPDWRDPVSGLSVREVARRRGIGPETLPRVLDAGALLPVTR